MTKHLFPYQWNLADGFPAHGIDYHGSTVFSTFAGGGGSSMGYKLAGYDVIGCNEIDPKMMDCYIQNLQPTYSFLEAIQTFKLKKDFPRRLYKLDVLDGSPPCSNFSMVGNREKDWGKKKKFREGQIEQVLDTLFFDFIDLVNELRPKIAIAENVKGILMGNAMRYRVNYVNDIYKAFDKVGYYCQHWLLNASKMGVPQRRERVFFIAFRKNLAKPFLYQKDMLTEIPKLGLEFTEDKIKFSEIDEGVSCFRTKITSKAHLRYIKNKTNAGTWRYERKFCGGKMTNTGFGYSVILNRVPHTITSAKNNIAYIDELHYISENEVKLIGSFPLDYNFMGNAPQYLIGMSVPPVMMAQIAHQVYLQWLSKI